MNSKSVSCRSTGKPMIVAMPTWRDHTARAPLMAPMTDNRSAFSSAYGLSMCTRLVSMPLAMSPPATADANTATSIE